MSHLISVEQLILLQRAAESGAGAAVRLLDVRWRLDRPEGRPEYVRAHLPGAVYVDLEHELAHRGEPKDGRHPLPPNGELQRAVRSWGVHDGDVVVAYDDNRSVPAARLWWLLRRVGIDARVLDGGIRAWAHAGLPLEPGDVRPAPSSIVLAGDGEAHGDGDGDHSDFAALRMDQVDDFTRHGVLLDVRTPEQYSGAHIGADPVGGHIPGAVNLPAMATADSEGRLHQPEALHRIFATAGIDEGTDVAVYCSSGVAAMHTVLALAHAGMRARVYPGSWSQWANTRGQPVAVGILPAGHLLTV